MKKFLHVLGKVEEFLLFLMVFQMGISVFVQVVMRYGFNSAITWLDELVHIEMVALCFFGASLGIRYSSHICVDVIKGLLKEPYSSLLEMATNLIVAAYVAAVTYLGMNLINLMIGQQHYTPTLRISKHYLYLMVCVGLILIGIRSLIKAYKAFLKMLPTRSGEISR